MDSEWLTDGLLVRTVKIERVKISPIECILDPEFPIYVLYLPRPNTLTWYLLLRWSVKQAPEV